MDKQTDMQAVIEAAIRGVAPQSLPSIDVPALFNPNGPNGRGEVVNLESYMLNPRRKRGTVDVFDVASFNQVLKDHSSSGTAIYVDRNPDKPAVEAVLNGHAEGAGWGDFRCRILFRATPQWVKWKGIDGKMLGQTEFAEFIEDNLDDIADPAGATMLEIATDLQAKRSVDFRRAVQLGSGQVQFENSESIEAKVGPGQLTVPTALTLSLAPLFGAPKYAVPARFRYRLTDGKLTLGLKLQRIEDLMRDVLEDVVAKIERSAGISVLEGTAPAAVRVG